MIPVIDGGEDHTAHLGSGREAESFGREAVYPERQMPTVPLQGAERKPRDGERLSPLLQRVGAEVCSHASPSGKSARSSSGTSHLSSLLSMSAHADRDSATQARISGTGAGCAVRAVPVRCLG